MWSFACCEMKYDGQNSLSLAVVQYNNDQISPSFEWKKNRKNKSIEPRSYVQTNKGGVAAWADVPKGTLGNLTPADRHGSVQVRAGAPPVYHPPLLNHNKYSKQIKNESTKISNSLLLSFLFLSTLQNLHFYSIKLFYDTVLIPSQSHIIHSFMPHYHIHTY